MKLFQSRQEWLDYVNRLVHEVVSKYEDTEGNISPENLAKAKAEIRKRLDDDPRVGRRHH